MTKRWERELRRLDDVDAPTERIRAHAADRPTDPSHEDGLPPRRQRITAGVVAVVVFVAAGTFAWQAFRPSGEKGDVVQPGPSTTVEIALVANHEDGPSSPTASLDVAGVSVPGVLTSYSWSDGNSTLNADTVAPSFGPSDYTPVALPAALEVTGDASAAEVAVQEPGEFPFATIEDLGAVTEAVPIDQGPGRYVLQVMAHWPQGDVPFYFPIELVPQVANAATLTFTAKDVPEARLIYADSVSGDVQAGVRGEYQWCDGTGACEGGIPEFPTYPPVSKFMEIPSGTSLMLESPVPSIKGGFLTMDGEKASPTFEDPEHFGSIPTEPGKYALEVHVALHGDNGAHGSATFWFGVDAIETENDSGQQVSDALHVECTSSGTLISEATVAAQHDGVHLEVDGSSAVAGGIHIDWAEQGTFRDSIGVGSNDVIVSIPPGSASVTCVPLDEEEANLPASFEVVDPEGRFQSPALGCETSSRQEAVLDAHSPEGAGREMWDRLKGILDSDVVKPEGYAARPDWENSVFWGIVLREGEPVASLRIYYSGTLEVLTCPGADISIDGRPRR